MESISATGDVYFAISSRYLLDTHRLLWRVADLTADGTSDPRARGCVCLARTNRSLILLKQVQGQNWSQSRFHHSFYHLKKHPSLITTFTNESTQVRISPRGRVMDLDRKESRGNSKLFPISACPAAPPPAARPALDDALHR